MKNVKIVGLLALGLLATGTTKTGNGVKSNGSRGAKITAREQSALLKHYKAQDVRGIKYMKALYEDLDKGLPRNVAEEHALEAGKRAYEKSLNQQRATGVEKEAIKRVFSAKFLNPR